MGAQVGTGSGESARVRDALSLLAAFPQLTEAMRETLAAAYRHALWNASQPIVLTDLTGRITATNPQLERVAGVSGTELRGLTAAELCHPEDRQRAVDVVSRLSSRESDYEELEARWVRPDSRIVWARVRAFLLVDDVSGDSYLVGLVDDVTEERLAQRQASALVDVARLTGAGAPLAVVAERIAAVAEDRWSGVGCSLTVLDADRQQLLPVAHGRLPKGYLEMLPPIPVGPAGAACGTAVETSERSMILDLRADEQAELFRPAAQRFGVVSAWSVPVVDPAGTTIGAFGLFHAREQQPSEHDWHYLEVLAGIAGMAVFVDERRARQAQEERALRVDPLTQLPNELALLEQLREPCATGAPITVALLQMHELGGLRWRDLSVLSPPGEDLATQLLTQLADRARALGDVRAVGLVAPMTLAVVADGEWTQRQAELLRRVLCLPVPVGEQLLRLDVRVGVAVNPAGETTAPGTLLRNATMSLPARGVALHDPTLARRQAAPYELAGQVRHAIRAEQLVLHYQPQYDLRSGEQIGSEALVRWQHPQQGLLAPGEFLQAVDIAGAGQDLTRYVVRRVVEDAERRRQHGLKGKVAVNVSAEDLHSEHLLEVLLDSGDRLWESIEIELTEGSLADVTTVVALEQLAAVGYEIALDDFGTGYSSLSALHAMPLSVVKIDQSFVQRLPSDVAVEGLIGAVSTMCGHLGITVVAEGIETVEQAVAVRSLGCTRGQGYLLSRPRPLEEHDGRPVPIPETPVTAGPVAPDPRTVELAVRLRTSGASARSIAAALNREGLRTATGSRWHPRSVARLLESTDTD